MSETQIDVLMREGERLIDRNRIPEALAHYQKLCELAPGNAEACFMYGAINLELGANSKAVDCFRKTIKIDPQHADAHMNLAVLLLSEGAADSAREHAHLATQLDPEFAEGWIILSKIQGTLKDFDGAETSARRALDLWPDDAEAAVTLAFCLSAKGKAEAALVAFTDALIRQPGHAEAWRQRAALEEQLNRWTEAEASSRKALTLSSDDTQSRIILARCLLLQRRAEEALPEFQQAVQRQPDSLDALKGLASTLEALGRLEDAIVTLRSALEVAPDSASVWFMLALIEYQQGKLEQALAHCGKAAELQSDFEPAHVLKGDLCRMLGRLPQALAAYSGALYQGTENINLNAVAGMVMTLDKLGRHDEAHTLLRPHLESGHTNQKLAVAFAGLCAHAEHCDEAIDLLENLLSSPSAGQDPRQATQDRLELHHHLGKLYDKAGDYSRAFPHFRKANEIARRNSPFNPDRHLKLTEEIMVEYTRERLQSAPTSGCNSERPLFIVGMPRSGTTLVEQILCSHPAVFGGGELQELLKIAAELGGHDARNLVQPPLIGQLSEEKLRLASERYLHTLDRLSVDATRVTDKMPYNYFHLGLIQLMFPRCKVIHCVRNPLDTCLSIYFQNFNGYQGFATDLRFIGTYYNAYRQLMHHWENVLGLSIHTIRYEELLENQEGETRKLLEYCGLEWNKACLEFYKNPRVAITASSNQIRKPLYRTSRMRWKNYEHYLGELKKTME